MPTCQLDNDDVGSTCPPSPPPSESPKGTPPSSPVPKPEREPFSPIPGDVLITLPDCGGCAATKQIPKIARALETGKLTEIDLTDDEGFVIAEEQNRFDAPYIVRKNKACDISIEGNALCPDEGEIDYDKVEPPRPEQTKSK